MHENENFNAGEFARFQEFLGFLLKRRVYSLVLRKYDIDLHYYDIGVYFLWLLYIYRIKETQEGRYYEQGKELYKCGNWQSKNRSSRKCRNMHWHYSRYGYERYRTRIVPWSVRRACCGAGFRGFQRQEKRTAEIRGIANFAFV